MPRELLIATRNTDKRRELSLLLGEDVFIHHPEEFSTEDVEETGNSLWENALLKARDGFTRSGLPTVADDTGIEVDALQGRPGVYSSRYAGINASYDDNVRKLLEELDGVEASRRTARFHTVVAYVDGENEKRFDGILEGIILEERRGEGGFGYDPVFLPLDGTVTLAEMGLAAKNRISHRGKAFRAFVDWWLRHLKFE